jgi:RNA polymerase sigma factor (sigma-70 family)
MRSPASPLTAERQALVTGVLRLIERKVTELAPWASGVVREDLVGAARMGATVAAARFSSSYGTRFTSYATPYICGAIKNHLTAERRQRLVLREAAGLAGREFMAEQPDDFKVIWDDRETNLRKLETLAERLFAAMMAGVAGAAVATPEEAVLELGAEERAVAIVHQAVSASPGIERRIYTMRYEEGHALVAIAAALGVAERTVRRHHEALLDRITALLHEGGITELPVSP